MKEHLILALFTVVVAAVAVVEVAANSGNSNPSSGFLASSSFPESTTNTVLVNQNQQKSFNYVATHAQQPPPPSPPTPPQEELPPRGFYDAEKGIYISGPPVNETGNTVLTVGYLTAIKGDSKDKQGLAISGAITIAIDEINNNPNLLPNVTLAMRWNDTRGDTVLATRAMTEMICDGVATFFGPEGNCNVEGIVSQSRNIPMIAYKCSDHLTSPIPTFARTEPPDTQVTKSIISLLKYYNWKKFSIIYDKSWGNVANSLQHQAEKENMTINHKKEVYDNHHCCEKNMDCCRTGYWYQTVRETMAHTRIYVFLGPVYTLNQLMEAMDSLKMFQAGLYMVIFVDMMTYSPREAHKYVWTPEQLIKIRNCNEIDRYMQRARSLLVIVSSPPAQNYENFTMQVREYNKREPFNFSTPLLFATSNYVKFVSIYAAYLYDSVMLYARALDKLLRLEQETRELTRDVIWDVAGNGTRIVETIIQNKTYQSVTGATIKMDPSGDSEGNFSVLSWKEQPFSENNFSCNFSMVPVAVFIQGDAIPEYKIINASVKIDWPGEDRPFDMPPCGFQEELCPRRDTHVMSMIIAGILGLVLFCAAVIVMSIYRKWKIELEIEGLLWKIEPHELGYFGNDMVASPSKLSLASAASYGSKYSNQVFTSTAKYKGVMVRIKELKFSKKKDISREIMKEMRKLRDLRHDNLNSFIGACVEPMRILLVTDYCAKGSLYDIVENEDIKLEDIFIASLVHDLIKAMLYIHSSYLGFHGNLKSSNCVVTSRWVLQVTDFGLHDLRQCAENESIGEHQQYRNFFWKAPELLRNPNVFGSRAGDVYAFSIILYEIIGRKGPFGSTRKEPKEIIRRVKRVPDISEYPFRPDLKDLVDTDHCPDYVLSCIQDCWAENPELRPDFATIRNRLKKMRGGKSKNIMDQMMEIMEKYTDNLEDIVDQRTRQLCEEKRKTEDLLHRMLPQSVAEKLTLGMGVEPVSYDSVTIYFSDIVGFTAMSAESTPLQVVNFLNDLYTVFDQIIKGYDVYKVETIGDAYMVVSGLPEKNREVPNVHVGEVASMALDLLEAVKSHKISHRPNETLKLRIGMHTGPVVAGVVGLTMPRYCLFGDTVNTASRMESNGEALKIHVSPDCKRALDKLGGYITEIRGPIYMKGKGEVVTHWLIGATEDAVQRKPVSLADLPPPLFCRPQKKSPKTESRASLRGGSTLCNPNLFMAAGRRHSQIPRNATDAGSMYSLQGSVSLYPSGSPRPLHRNPSKIDRTPLYIHGSRSTLVESVGDGVGVRGMDRGSGGESHDSHEQMEMGTLVRKKHSVSMDGEQEQEDHVRSPSHTDEEENELPTRQLLINRVLPAVQLIPKKISVTIKSPSEQEMVPDQEEDEGMSFKTFNRKRASFDPSNLQMLRESRSLDRFPSSDQRKKRLSFKKLTSKLTFSSSNNNRDGHKENAPKVPLNNTRGGRSVAGAHDGCGASGRGNGQTSDYFTVPNSSDSYSFIDNSILKFSGDGLLLPPTPMVRKQQPPPPPQPPPQTSSTSSSVGTQPQRVSRGTSAGNGPNDYTVINCNGYEGPLVVHEGSHNLPHPPSLRRLAPARPARNDSLCLSRNSETECEEEDHFDKKWRSMDTLKDKRKSTRSVVVGRGASHAGVVDGRRQGTDYYFDSASDDNRSVGEENNRRINFVDEFQSGEEAEEYEDEDDHHRRHRGSSLVACDGESGDGSDSTTAKDTDSVCSSSTRSNWFKSIFNNGNNGSNSGSQFHAHHNPNSHSQHHHHTHHHRPAAQKPDNLLLNNNNNNNNNNNSNRNKNHKRLSFGAKVTSLEAIKQSPEAKEDDEEAGEVHALFVVDEKEPPRVRGSGGVSGGVPGVADPPTVVVESPSPPQELMGKLNLNAAPFVETSASSLECGEHAA